MINFRRKDEKIQVEIQHGIFFTDKMFVLEINQAQDYQAELLKRQLQENLNNHIIRIKAKAYQEGWKAAKAKTKKQTEFYGGWV